MHCSPGWSVSNPACLPAPLSAAASRHAYFHAFLHMDRSTQVHCMAGRGVLYLAVWRISVLVVAPGRPTR